MWGQREMGGGGVGAASLWVNKNQKSSYWLWSPLPFERNPKPGRLWRAALVEAGEEMQCDTNRLKEEVLMDWIKQGGGGGKGLRGWWVGLWGHDTNVFHWQVGKAPLLCHTHTWSHKFMHLFTEKPEQGHFPMHTLMKTYTNICFKLKLEVWLSAETSIQSTFTKLLWSFPEHFE